MTFPIAGLIDFLFSFHENNPFCFRAQICVYKEKVFYFFKFYLRLLKIIVIRFQIVIFKPSSKNN